MTQNASLAQFANSVTATTGTGNLVFSTSPILQSPIFSGTGGTIYVGSSGQTLVFGYNGNNYITTQGNNSQLVFQTNSSQNALLIDSSQNATFSGNVTINNSTTLVPGGLAVAGNTTPVSNVSMAISYKWESSPSLAESFAYLWNDKTYARYVFNANWNASNTAMTTNSPAVTLLSIATNTGSLGESVAHMAIGKTTVANTTTFARNAIVTCDVLSNVKMFGDEIDFEPSVGATLDASSVAMQIVGFNLPDLKTAFLIGTGSAGAKFTTGISFLNGIGSNAIAAQSGLNCGSFIDLSAGTYTYGSIIFGNGTSNQLYFKNTGGSQAAGIYVDSGGNTNLTHSSGAIITSGGSSTEGTQIWSIRNASGVEAIGLFAGSGTSGSTTGCILKVKTNSSTNRSINTGGTINASGADYAEYEFKAPGVSNIAKGQIIGFDLNGCITDRFDDSISFGVKSTSPNLVGGDNWASHLPEPPPTPIPPDAVPDKPVLINVRDHVKQAIADEDHKKLITEWTAKVEAREEALKIYESEMAQYQNDLTAWQADFDVERSKVDRIAYCGKVPINITTAKIGEYIIPIRASDGSIDTKHEKNPSFEEYKISIGRVRKILEDGRCEIVVKCS